MTAFLGEHMQGVSGGLILAQGYPRASDLAALVKRLSITCGCREYVSYSRNEAQLL